MGDEAEGEFEKWAEQQQLGYVRLGLNRPPLAVHLLPTRLRYLPDYLLSKNFVEVQGVGRDQTVKVKIEKYNSLRYWNDLHEVRFFIWDRTNERTAIFPLGLFDGLLGAGKGTLGAFSEGKAWFGFRADDLIEAAP